MSLILFFLAAGYSNNLIFMLVFFMISLGVSSTHFTNNNVKQAEILGFSFDRLFVNSAESVFIQVGNENLKKRLSMLKVSFLNKQGFSGEISDLKPQETQQVAVRIFFAKRGLQKLPVVMLESEFPFGFLKAWKIKDFPGEVMVYPELKGHRSFPREASQDPAQNSFGIFRDHKLYQPTDSKNKIDWRASAKRQSILVKNFEEPEGLKLSFRWEQTSQLEDIEERISQLALWVHEAEKMQADYALHLGQFSTEFSHGFHHWKNIMDHLATVQVKV